MNDIEKLYKEKLKEMKSLESIEETLEDELEKIDKNLKGISLRRTEYAPRIDKLKLFNNLYEDAMKELNQFELKLNAVSDVREEKEVGAVPEVKNLPTMKDVRKEMKIDIDENEQIFVMKRYTTNKKVTVDADLIKKNGKYVVLAGSLLSKHINAESVKKLREKYAKVIDVDYILNRNIAFGTLQRATSFVLGFISNGDSAWILEETGKTIGFYEEQDEPKDIKQPVKESKKPNEYVLKGVVSDSGAKVNAEVIEIAGKYFLKEGSLIATKMRASIKTNTIVRRKFNEGTVASNGKLLKDVHFDDLVNAGIFVTGFTNDETLKWEAVK